MLAHDFDVDTAVEETFKVAESKRGDEDTFSNHAPIYLAPTGKTKEAVQYYLKKKRIKKALAVGSQGSFAHELALNGVEKIDCFDKNILQYLYYALFETAIKTLNFDEFIRNFTSEMVSSNHQEMSRVLSDWMFFEVLDELGGKEAEYWAKIYKTGKKNYLIGSSLFRTYYPFFIETLSDFSSVYTKEGFKRLKELLKKRKVDITYHICDLDEIHQEFYGEKYDLMMFGNILQYYQQIPSLNTVEKVNDYANNQWMGMLNENGCIQLNYGFEVVGTSIRELLYQEEENEISDFPAFMMRYQVEKDKRDGLIAGILTHYGVGQNSPYSIEFISAAEERDGHQNSKNVLLTYQPKRNG